MGLEITSRKVSEQLVILSLAGRITAATAASLKFEIMGQLQKGFLDMILDLQQVEFIDSSGLSAIVSGLKQIREIGGTFKLAGMKNEVQTIFNLTMLDKVFELYPSLESALASKQV